MVAASSAERLSCDVCGTALSPTGQHKTLLCFACRQEGAEFALEWSVDLLAAGHDYDEIATVTGSTGNSVRARISERRRGLR